MTGLSALPVAALLLLANPLSAAAADPPGNNGTIKVDGVAFDSHPDNEPHVGCNFEVDFYGFDKGDYNATVTFTAQAPTGNGQVIETDTVPIGEDDNAGGGSQAGLDAQREYDLSAALVGYPEQKNQGYHVKLTVNAPGSQGADTKHKVFWVRDCTTTANSVTSTSTTTTTTRDRTIVTTGGTTGDTAGRTNTDVLGNSLTNPGAAQPGTSVLGETLAQTDGEAPAANLAATGSPITLSLMAAAIALALGAVARYFGKRTPALTHG